MHTLPVREQRRRRSTQALQAAALSLVSRSGFDSASVDDIAAEAGVSRRTFFNHFPTKAAALFDPDPDDAERLARLLAACDGTADPWSALQSVCTSFVAGHEHVIVVRRRLVAESPDLDQYHRTAHRHVEVALHRWALGQRGADPYAAALMAQSAATVMTGAFTAWQADQHPDVLVELVARGFSVVQVRFGQPHDPAAAHG